MYGGTNLPLTGAGVLMAGHIVGLDVMVAVGVGLVLGGISVYRLGAKVRRRVTS